MSAAVLSSPAIANGVVYVGKNTAEVLAYRLTGCGHFGCQPLFDAFTQNPIVSSSPAVVNGAVYIGSGDQFDGQHPGRLYVYQL